MFGSPADQQKMFNLCRPGWCFLFLSGSRARCRVASEYRGGGWGGGVRVYGTNGRRAMPLAGSSGTETAHYVKQQNKNKKHRATVSEHSGSPDERPHHEKPLLFKITFCLMKDHTVWNHSCCMTDIFVWWKTTPFETTPVVRPHFHLLNDHTIWNHSCCKTFSPEKRPHHEKPLQ